MYVTNNGKYKIYYTDSKTLSVNETGEKNEYKFVVPNTFTQNLDFNHKLEEFKTQEDCMKNLIDYENSLTSDR